MHAPKIDVVGWFHPLELTSFYTSGGVDPPPPLFPQLSNFHSQEQLVSSQQYALGDPHI